MILDAVVLAAGAGSRFGGGKLTTPWRGGVLLDGALAAAFAAPVAEIVVVHGADAAVPKAARVFFEARGAAERLKLIYAPDHTSGLSASLRAGIAAVSDDRDGAFVFLGDMPHVSKSTTLALAAALADGAVAAAPIWRGRRGHPVLFGRATFPALLTRVGDEGARAILSDLGGGLVAVATDDEGVVMDVDLPSDLSDPCEPAK